jgi:hypothetical protein
LAQRKSLGVRDWYATAFGYLRCIARWDDYSYVIGGDVDSNYSLWRVEQPLTATAPSTYVWRATFGGTVTAVAVDADQNVYAVGHGTNNVKKFNSSGVLQWEKSHGYNVYAVAVDEDGYVYIGGVEYIGVTNRKYDPDGNEVDSFTVGETVYAISLIASSGGGTDPEPGVNLVSLVSNAGISDAASINAVSTFQSSLNASTLLALQTAITLTPTASTTLTDTCFSIVSIDLPTTISVTDDLNAAVRAVLELAILLEAQDTQTSSIIFATNLLEGLVVQDLFYQLAALDLDDAMDVADQLSSAIRAHLALPETATLLAELETAIVIPCADSIAVTDTGAVSVSALLSLSDGAAFIARLPLEDGDYQAWVMNAETTGTTTYANYPMGSVFTFQGVPYGVNETGLYRLEGETDDGEPINAVVATGDMNFGLLGPDADGREKNIPRAYLYLTQTGQVVLKTVTSLRGSRSETYYELAERTTDSTDDDTYRRVPLGRGVRGVWWRFEIHALNGATINLDGAEVRPVVLSRRG